MNQPTIVRRSERGLQPLTRYDPSEYILLTDGESLKAMMKLWRMNTIGYVVWRHG